MTLDGLVAKFLRMVQRDMGLDGSLGPALPDVLLTSNRYLGNGLDRAPFRWRLWCRVPLYCGLLVLLRHRIGVFWPRGWISKCYGGGLVPDKILGGIKRTCSQVWIRHTKWLGQRYAVLVPRWLSHLHWVALAVDGRHLGVGTAEAPALATKIPSMSAMMCLFSQFFFTLPFFIWLQYFLSFFRDSSPPKVLSCTFVRVERGSG